MALRNMRAQLATKHNFTVVSVKKSKEQSEHGDYVDVWVVKLVSHSLKGQYVSLSFESEKESQRFSPGMTKSLQNFVDDFSNH